MAINSLTISDSAWTAITNAGQSGTCWLQQKPDEGRVVIHHSDAGSGSFDIDDGYFLPDNKSVVTSLFADNEDDIFYARCTDDGDTALIVTDLI